ncbi:hypothetical protein RIF29_15958 [Crotalaria pallida]|uniref:Methyltransferase type 11 domain-containing protein n=1 Tax=Crotalaria pallida TaxID=3830 RepID=A0AAN9FEG7_CROPI
MIKAKSVTTLPPLLGPKMNVHCFLPTISLVSFPPKTSHSFFNEATTHKSPPLPKRVNSDAGSLGPTKPCCFCGRRHLLIEAAAALGTTTLFPIQSSKANISNSDYPVMVNKFHPPRPDWYEEFYASVMNSAMESYEAEVATYKSQIFGDLKGKVLKILEVGIGTGPNLRFYASDSDVQVVGIDPNPKMEKYARSSAASAGLPPTNFEFIQAVGEAVPLGDASVDAVVGTLVLCSVNDVDMTLKEVMRVLRPGGQYMFVEHVAAKDGTFLKFIQRVLDPLQQAIADGCHLSRETGNNISRAGFSSVELNMAFLSNATFINPHAYGIAYNSANHSAFIVFLLLHSVVRACVRGVRVPLFHFTLLNYLCPLIPNHTSIDPSSQLLLKRSVSLTLLSHRFSCSK